MWKDDNDNKPIDERTVARQRAREKVQSTIRVLRYKNYIRTGLAPAEAARRMGVKVSPYDRTDPLKLLQRIEKGK